MAKRQSVNGSRARHENPIPNASRIGNIVMSSVIGGIESGHARAAADAASSRWPTCSATSATTSRQPAARVDDIIKITFWVKDPAKQRAALNDEWVRMFPDRMRARRGTHPAGRTRPVMRW